MVLKEFRPRIYCDMDGVLTDFNKQFAELHPWSPERFTEKNGKDEFWELIDGRGVGFWVGMDWMEDGKELFKFILKTSMLSCFPHLQEQNTHG